MVSGLSRVTSFTASPDTEILERQFISVIKVQFSILCVRCEFYYLFLFKISWTFQLVLQNLERPYVCPIINVGALILVLHFHMYNRGLRFSDFLDSRTDQTMSDTADCSMISAISSEFKIHFWFFSILATNTWPVHILYQ